MYYQQEITIPANTSESGYITEVLKLAKGKITRVIVGFPLGCAGLVHITINDKGWQLIPWSPGKNLAWDNYVFDLGINYRIDAEPYELVLRGWNLDDSYAHTLFVGVLLTEGGNIDNMIIQQYPIPEGVEL